MPRGVDHPISSGARCVSNLDSRAVGARFGKGEPHDVIWSGASATAVQKILGHRSAAFTLTVYGHIFDEDLDVVAENLDQGWSAKVPGRGRQAALIALQTRLTASEK